jgi:hypothetical protein
MAICVLISLSSFAESEFERRNRMGFFRFEWAGKRKMTYIDPSWATYNSALNAKGGMG